MKMYTEDMVLEREEDEEAMKIYEVKIKGQDAFRFRVGGDDEVKLTLDENFIVIEDYSDETYFACQTKDFEYFLKVDEGIL